MLFIHLLKFISAAESVVTHEIEGLINNTPHLHKVPEDFREIVSSISEKKNSISEEIKSGAFTFIVFFSDKSEDVAKLKDLEDVPGFRHFFSSDKELANSLGVEFPGVFAYNSVDKNILRLPFYSSVDTTLATVTLNALLQLRSVSYKSLQQLIVPIFYFIDNKRDFEAVKQSFGDLCKEFSSQCKFLFFSPDEVGGLINMIEPAESDYPMIVFLSRNRKTLVRSITTENFRTSVNSILSNNSELLRFSSKIPADNDSRGLRVLNSDTVADFIANKSVDRIISFTTTSCQYCLILKPEIERLGKILKSHGISIIFGDYNILENEEIDNYRIEKVPQLYFFKKDSQEPILLPSELRTASSIFAYLKENSSDSRISTLQIPELEAVQDTADNLKEAPETTGEAEQTMENVPDAVTKEDVL